LLLKIALGVFICFYVLTVCHYYIKVLTRLWNDFLYSLLYLFEFLLQHDPYDLFKFLFHVVLAEQSILQLYINICLTIVYSIVIILSIVLRLVLFVAALLVFTMPFSLVFSPFRLLNLCFSRLIHHYLRKIYSPHFNKNKNIRRYVELSMYLTKCTSRGARFEITILLIPLAIIVIGVLLGLIFVPPFLIFVFSLFACAVFAALGIWLGAVDARVYVDVIVRGRSCYESLSLSKKLKGAIFNLGLKRDYYKLFSDRKAMIGFFTFTIIALGSLWYVTMFLEHVAMVGVLGNNGNNATNKTSLIIFEEILQKFIWPSTPTNDRDVYDLVQEFLFMSVFYFFSFALTLQYYTFVFSTLINLKEYLKDLRKQNKRFMNVKRLEQKLFKDVLWDVAIPFMSIFLRYIWTGKALKALIMGELSLCTLIYALMLILLLNLPMAPVAYYLRFFPVESILRRLFRLIFRISSSLNFILSKIR